MARIRNRRKPVAEMNVVPYIDVMLVLLIIFMVAAPLSTVDVPVDDLLRGLFGDGFATDGAVRHTDARPQQTQVVVDLGDGAHRGTRVARGRLLVDGHRRGQPLDEVDVGLVHLTEELTCVGRQGLDVAALTLGEDRVEGQG